jgi:lipopolysaccharide biosynthesis protein
MHQLNQALVIAHFHQDGKLRADTLNFLESCQGLFKRLIFVSTNLSEDQRVLIPNFVECHVRENIGYDFLSYHLGISQLVDAGIGLDRPGENFERLTLMNTSFIICDVNKFINTYFYESLPKTGVDFFGLTMHESDGVVPMHLQSFLFSFNRRVLSDESFLSWWAGVQHQGDKKAIIQNYEIGLSVFLNDLGYEMGSIYQLPASQLILDPMHGNFEEILDKYGILKIGLFKINPFRLNLDPLILKAQADEKFRLLLVDGMEN